MHALNSSVQQPQDSKAYRLLYEPNRQKELVDEVLRYYANYLVFSEAEDVENNLTYKNCLDLQNVYNDIKNGFCYKICLNAWILFVDNGETHYLRLVDTNDSLTREITSFAKQVLCSIGNEREKKLLTQSLLELARITPREFKEAKKFLEKYRNKALAHVEDYSPQKAQDPEHQLSYPKLLPLAKLAYGLFRIILEVKRIQENDLGINIHTDGLGKNFSFDELIDHYKKGFKNGLSQLPQLLKI